MNVVYLNGDFLPKEEAKVSVDDRGFLFGDGVYEVTPAYQGRLFRFPEHLSRMRKGLAALRIAFDPDGLEAVKLGLLVRNALDRATAAYVYVQVTRGVAPRSHAFPNPAVSPSVYAFARPYRRPSPERWDRGFKAVTIPDQRWARADIKAIALLPNVLAQQAAADAGVGNAIFIRDGMAMEGAHNNLFVVSRGIVATAPKSNYILHGITRDFVMELARGMGIPVRERAIPLDDLFSADEVFFTGTTTEIRPAVVVDGKAIGEGRPGPVTRRLFEAFLQAVAN